MSGSLKIHHIRRCACNKGHSKGGAITIVSNIIKNEEGNPTQLEYAIAFTPSDMEFDKSVITQYAKDRLNEKNSEYYRVLELKNNKYFGLLLRTYIITDIMLNVTLPNKNAKKIIKNEFDRITSYLNY